MVSRLLRKTGAATRCAAHTMTSLQEDLLQFALSLPEAWEDHPWGETVAKVGKKIFVFFGSPDPDLGGMTVKLRDSQEPALSVEGAKPAGYGLGRSGWVSVTFGPHCPGCDLLKDWIEESYRLIAPKRLAALVGPEHGEAQ